MAWFRSGQTDPLVFGNVYPRAPFCLNRESKIVNVFPVSCPAAFEENGRLKNEEVQKFNRTLLSIHTMDNLKLTFLTACTNNNKQVTESRARCWVCGHDEIAFGETFLSVHRPFVLTPFMEHELPVVSFR
jgi:hypothetical protein